MTSTKAAPILLLLGGNQGDVIAQGKEVERQLSAKYQVVTTSAWYQSPSWGFDGPDFLNCIVELTGAINPMELLESCMQIEKDLGRERKGVGYSDRPMDIDILYIGEEIIQSQRLTVPHPRIGERKFTLVPLCEKWSEFKHPIQGRTQAEMLEVCTDESPVIRTRDEI